MKAVVETSDRKPGGENVKQQESRMPWSSLVTISGDKMAFCPERNQQVRQVSLMIRCNAFSCLLLLNAYNGMSAMAA